LHFFGYFLHFVVDIIIIIVYLIINKRAKTHNTNKEAVMEKRIEWKTSTGKKASVEVSLVLEERINADGDIVTVPACDMRITAEVEGMGTVGCGHPSNPVPAVKKQYPQVVGTIGKLAIMAPQMDQIKAAIAEFEATPEWQAKMKKRAQAEIESREYEAHCARMKKAMGY
jgi:hypothetical protein